MSRGERLNLIISEVLMAEMDDGEKAIVHFKGIEKGLALNKTNANMITEIAGTDETDEWTGIPVCLFVTKVDYQGKRVDALRVDYSDNAKPPVTHVGNGNGAAKQAAQEPVDKTDWKMKINEKLKAYCTEQKLEWNENKVKLLDTYAGTQNFVTMTQAEAKQGCANLDDPNFLPF